MAEDGGHQVEHPAEDGFGPCGGADMLHQVHSASCASADSRIDRRSQSAYQMSFSTLNLTGLPHV